MAARVATAGASQLKGMTATSVPRKIDLAEEMELHGVVVPQEMTDAQPANEPVFLGYQQRWFEDQSPIMIAEKSRRTGLTWAEAGRNVINAAKPRSRRGCNTFYVGSKQEMALEYIAACALFAKAFNELAEAAVYEQTFWDSGKKEEILAYMIRFPKSGFKIQALSSRPSNLRGLQGDVVIDEAAFHESLEELLKAALALTMWGNKVRLISTHNGVDNAFNTYISDAREGRKDYSIHRITLDAAIAEGLYKRICFVTGQVWTPEAQKAWREALYKNAPNPESAAEEYGCVPKKSGGAYLSRVLIEAAMVADHSIRIYRYEAPEGFESWTTPMREAEVEQWCVENLAPELARLSPLDRHVLGEDFARRGDLTVFCPLAIAPSLRKRVPFVVELRNLTYEQQRQVLFYIMDRLPRRTGAAFDATANGGYLAEQAGLRYGANTVDQVNLSQAWYALWMPKLKGELESFNLLVPRHQTTLDDLLHIKVVNGIPLIDKGRQKDLDAKDGKGKRHGDFAVALVMAVRASFMDGSLIEYTAAPSRADRWSDTDSDDQPGGFNGAW
ncbi:terminase large subunit domain-containing protein [Pseudomonas sp. D47]|uniref:terminase large subunit domain-containing protein n=1 Tax=Pseudomonas sp. D47 TaxID=3159447 RepID=UPI00387B61A4